MKAPLRTCLRTGVLLLFLHCIPQRFPVLPPSTPLSRDAEAAQRAAEYFIASRNADYQGLGQVALGLLEQAHRLDPSSQVLRDQLVRKYLEGGKYLQALVLIKDGKKSGELDSSERRMVAGIYVKTGEFANAIETLERLDSKKDADYYSIALLAESLNDKDKALKYYRLFFERSGRPVEIGLKIARLEAARQRLPAADSILVTLQKERGESAPVGSMRGAISLLRGDTVAALDFFNRAVAIDSLSEEGLRGAAQIHLEKNNYPQAIACYEQLYRISQLFKEVFGRTLAILYYYNGDFASAETVFMELLEKANDDAEYHHYLGLVSAAQNKNDVARIEFEKAIALKTDFIDAWRELCNVFLRGREYDQSLAVAERLVEALPKEKEAWRIHAYVLTLRKEYPRALNSLHTAITLDSLDASVWFELGSCYERNRETGKAAAAFRKVLKLRPGDPTASNFLGYMWIDKKMNLDSARVLVESALEHEPGNGAYLDSYAWLWYQKGDIEKAVSYMIEAMYRTRSDPVIFEHYGDMLLKTKNISGALDAYQSCLERSDDDSETVRAKILECESLLRMKQ